MLKFVKSLLYRHKSPPNYFQLIGETKGIEELVHNFYDVMENDQKAKDCLTTHPLTEGKVPEDVKTKLCFFISGWLGGPNLFVENFGHPRMRKRHIHIKIGEKEKEQWLYCMQEALNKHSIKMKKKYKENLLRSFMALAMRIKNQD